MLWFVLARSLIAFTVATAVLMLGVPAALADNRTERGIVQSVAPQRLAIRVLDGSTVTIVVDRRTKVTVDGRRAALGAVRPGFVVVVSVRVGGTAARQVRAYDPVRAPTTDRQGREGRPGQAGSRPGGRAARRRRAPSFPNPLAGQ